MSFENDEAFETFLSEVEDDAKEYVQEEANDGLEGIKAPVKGKGDTSKQAPKEEIKSLFQNIL